MNKASESYFIKKSITEVVERIRKEAKEELEYKMLIRDAFRGRLLDEDLFFGIYPFKKKIKNKISMKVK